MSSLSIIVGCAAGLAAAAVAYVINWVALRRLGRDALWLAVPAIEETLKSSLPALLGAPLLAAHVAFGLVEAVYELAGQRPSHTAAGLALLTHTGFGFLTVTLAARGTLGPAIVAAVALHSTFNLAVIKRAGTASRARGATSQP